MMTKEEKIQLFKSLFRGRTDCFGAENECVKTDLTDEVVVEHLTGRRRIGVYMMLADSIYFACIDIDRDAFDEVLEIVKVAEGYGLSCSVERSKRKGYHIWLFFTDPTLAAKVRAVLKQIVSDSAVKDVEIFPKQDFVGEGEFGNFVNLPLFKNDLPQKTAFVDTNTVIPYENQWEYMASIEKNSPKYIDDIIELNDIEVVSQKELTARPRAVSSQTQQDNIKRGDLSKVVNGCAFIQHCKENATTLSEQQWYDMICNLAALEGGQDAIHELSSPYPNYTYEETQGKIEHALKDAPAPTTCALIREHGFECSKQCGVNAPAGLAYKGDGKKEVSKITIEPMPIYNLIGEAQTKPILAGLNKTDLGNAERFGYYYGDTTKYCHDSKCWFIWNGRYWEQDRCERIKNLAKDTVRKIYAEASFCDSETGRKSIADHARKSEANSRIVAMLALAQSDPTIAINKSGFDTNGWLVNCQNGTVDIRTGELLSFNKADLLTKTTPIIYDINADCPRWKQFLNEIFEATLKPNASEKERWEAEQKKQELIRFIQRAVGYSLTIIITENCIFLCYGIGRNGKSVFLDTLEYIFGDYGCRVEPYTFEENKRSGASASEDIARLDGIRFISTVETGQNKKLAENLLKQMTGDKTMTARYLYQNSFQFDQTYKIWFATNHKPIIRGTDEGIWSRIRLIPFEVTFTEDKQDKKLREKLIAEAPGVFNWILEGCRLWLSGGLTQPEKVMQATAEYRAEMDVLKAFIDDCCIVETGKMVTKKDLYEAYTQWCDENGERPESQRKFNANILELDCGIQDSRTMVARVWYGIGLLELKREDMSKT